MSSLRQHYQVGPLLARSVAEAETVDKHKWSAWQWGAQSAARAMESHRPVFQVMASGAVGAVVGVALPHFWVWRALLGAAAALATFWLIPTIWAVVAFFVAPVKQRDAARCDLRTARDELTAGKQRVEMRLDLRDIAWIIANESIRLREALTIPEVKDQLDIPDRIEWFRNMADTAAAKMEQSGLADRADEYRVRHDDDGLLAPLAIDNGRLESVQDLVSMMDRYQLSLVALVREWVGQLVQPSANECGF